MRSMWCALIVPLLIPAFVIEHTDKASDYGAVYTAEILGALRTYEAILKEKPKAKWAFPDDLIARREQGTLETFARTACK